MANFVNPYNFVSISSKVREKTGFTSHDRFTGNSGKITCTLDVITPFFIPDPQDSYELDNGHKIKVFFKLKDKPAIPPTELKGMIRSIMEAVSNSCLSQIDREGYDKLTYRIEAEDAKRFEPGIVIKTAKNENGIIFPLEKASILIEKLNTIGLKNGGYAFAIIELKKIGNKVLEISDEQFSQFSETEKQIQRQVIIKQTGIFTTDKLDFNKKNERVFYSDTYTMNLKDKLNDAEKLNQKIEFTAKIQNEYNNVLKEQLEDEDFKKFYEKVNGENKKELMVNDLIYYHTENSSIARVLVPRMMYKTGIRDLIQKKYPELLPCTQIKNLCPCCRIFGMVHEKESLAGKVSFNFATINDAYELNPEQFDKNNPDNLNTLKILGSPHPTCCQFYLLNDSPDKPPPDYDKENVKLRGRKFYYNHKIEMLDYKSSNKNKQNTSVQLLMKGKFNFTIDFYNLDNIELGLLLYALQLEPGMLHKLGMGKPLGLGSVKINITQLDLIERKNRYLRILEKGETPYTDDNLKNKIEEFISDFKQEQAKNEPKKHEFDKFSYIRDIKAVLNDNPTAYPIKYPSAKRNNESYGYEWFSKHKGTPLPMAHKIKGTADREGEYLTGWE